MYFLGKRTNGEWPVCSGAALQDGSGRIARTPRLRLRWLLSVFMGCVLTGALSGLAQNTELEYKVKAGFLFNFAKFVEWPAASFDSPKSPIVIGVMAEDASSPVLQQVLDGKMVNGRLISVTPLQDAAGLSRCHMIFLGRTVNDRFEDILKRSKGLPVLTVGEAEQFAEKGGMIGFVREDENFRLQINLETATQAGLKVSAKLSSIARIVKTKRDK